MFRKVGLAFALMLMFAMPAHAEVDGLYGGVKFIDSIQSTGSTSHSDGMNFFGVDTYGQNSVGGGIFVGYDFYPKFQAPLRVEIEYALRSNTNTEWSGVKGTRKGSIDATWNVQTLFANAYFDFHNSTKFTPYIGGGLGMGFINSSYDINGRNGESISASDLNTVFAWNVGAGCSYAFTDNISADLAYRYVGLGENKVSFMGQDITTQPSANEISLGLRFTF